MIGQILNNRYTITSRLGKGAMGIVYRATDTQTGQEVALKVIASELSVEPEMLERFKREGEALRQLKHLNIVGFLDAFQYNEQYVIVMEFVTGGSLHELIKQGPLSIERASQIALDLCDALIRSHRVKIIHRDIKPENVLMAEDGTPKLADFGVARLSEGTRMTRSGTQVGTPYYMAPEAWDGETLDAQSDIWSLGVMLFEMLTGTLPFTGDTPLVVMNKVSNSSPPEIRKLRADVPPDLAKIVNRMLNRDKKRRYQTMREVSVDLERSVGLISNSAPASDAESLLRNGNSTSIRKLGIGALLLTALILGAWGIKSLMLNFLAAPAVISSPNETVTPTLKNTLTPVLETTLTEVSFTSTPAPTLIPEIGSTEISPKDGMISLFVPKGEFTMGSDLSDQAEGKPVHQVNLDDFWIDQTEVTNAMYEKCVADDSCNPPTVTRSFTRVSYFGNPEFDNYPVVYVSWGLANAYCSWAERRLPTEAEWEKAARGTDGRIYPWGNESPNDSLLNFNSTIGDTTQVGSYEKGKSFYGAYDMAGNVWEWVSTLYESYPYNANDGRESLSSDELRVLRGGSWLLSEFDVSSVFRVRYFPAFSSDNYGFRCARSR